jgi:hypothetical protein
VCTAETTRDPADPVSASRHSAGDAVALRSDHRSPEMPTMTTELPVTCDLAGVA